MQIYEKSDKPVDIPFVFWKLEELFVMTRSVEVGLLRLLKQVGSLTIFFAFMSKTAAAETAVVVEHCWNCRCCWTLLKLLLLLKVVETAVAVERWHLMLLSGLIGNRAFLRLDYHYFSSLWNDINILHFMWLRQGFE